MNFLAHFWLTERAGLRLSGALLGDLLRGPVSEELPPDLSRSVRLHRRIDVLTDSHPRVVAARAAFPEGPRRYAGILLDLVYDHCLARAWPQYAEESLAGFAGRCAEAVAGDREWFERFGHRAPNATLFAALLRSYESESGIERAMRRTARRLKRSQGLIEAMAGWRRHIAPLSADLPVLLRDLEAGAQAALNSDFSASSRPSL